MVLLYLLQKVSILMPYEDVSKPINFRQPPPPIECKYQITLVHKAVKLQGYTTSKHVLSELIV